MLGIHVNRDYINTSPRPHILSHIKQAILEAKNYNITLKSVAIFVGGPKNKVINLHEDERKELRDYINESELVVIAHSSYASYPFNNNPESVEYILKESKVCKESGIKGLVIHLPKSHADTAIPILEKLIDSDVTIYLENPAHVQPDSYYETPEKLNYLFSKINKKFGLCIDTAHLWVSGTDISSYDKATQWLNKLTIHPSRVMFHLNDATHELGKGPDTHAPLMKGKIWKNYNELTIKDSGLVAFMDYINRNNSVFILERKPKEALINDYLILRNLI